jgi:hypothetical protein
LAVEAIDCTVRTSTARIQYQRAVQRIEQGMTEARAAVAQHVGLS